MSSPDPLQPAPVPGLARATVGGVCAVLMLTGLGEAALALLRDPRNWSMFGFAAMTAVTAGFGIAFAAGKLRDAAPMTLACIAGSVLVCSALGSFGLDRWFVPAVSKKWWLVGRGVLTAALLVVAVVLTLRSRRESWRLMLLGSAWAAPLIVLGFWYALARLKPLLTPGTGAGEFFRLGVLVVLGLLAIASVSGVTHCVLRAFETALPPRDAPASGADA